MKELKEVKQLSKATANVNNFDFDEVLSGLKDVEEKPKKGPVDDLFDFEPKKQNVAVPNYGGTTATVNNNQKNNFNDILDLFSSNQNTTYASPTVNQGFNSGYNRPSNPYPEVNPTFQTNQPQNNRHTMNVNQSVSNPVLGNPFDFSGFMDKPKVNNDVGFVNNMTASTPFD